MSNDPRIIDFIARVCHEANREIQIATGDPAPSPSWNDAEEWQKASALEGVIHALEGKTPEQLHESWCDFKRRDGWVYGIHKDPQAKTHPCLVDYDQLPPEQRLKDNIFLAIVKSFRGVQVIG